MSMTPKERILAVLNGEEPDKTPVCVFEQLLTQHRGGWSRRLKERGLGLLRGIGFYRPAWEPRRVWGSERGGANPGLSDVKYTSTEYFEKGIWKYRQTYETPVGSITGVLMANPVDYVAITPTPEEYYVKLPSDWRVINYIIKGMLDNLAPRYEYFEMAQEELGEDGVAYAGVGKTAWQSAWTQLAGPERAVIDFHEQPEEIQEYIDLNKRYYSRVAELAAGCPAEFVDFGENTSDMISPKYYREYCLPIYEIYSQQLAGTDKVLGVHMDGRLGNLRKEIAETPINIVESFSVPPTGDISLAEARAIWPDKMIFMNTAAHLAWAKPKEVRKFYEALAEEWGGKKGLLLELTEQLPLETVEAHMSAAMDAFGY